MSFSPPRPRCTDDARQPAVSGRCPASCACRPTNRPRRSMSSGRRSPSCPVTTFVLVPGAGGRRLVLAPPGARAGAPRPRGAGRRPAGRRRVRRAGRLRRHRRRRRSATATPGGPGRPVDGRAHRAAGLRPAAGRAAGAGQRDDPGARARPAASGGPSPARPGVAAHAASEGLTGDADDQATYFFHDVPRRRRRRGAWQQPFDAVRPAVRGPVAAGPLARRPHPGARRPRRPLLPARVPAPAGRRAAGPRRRRGPGRAPRGPEPARSSWPTTCTSR